MFSLALCVVLIILKVKANETATENPEIRLIYSNDTEEMNYTVWKDKPLKIVIENNNTHYVWCRSSYVNNLQINSPDFIPTTAFNYDGIAELFVNVTAEMSTRWVCTVLKTYEANTTSYKYLKMIYTAKKIFFNLHVRGAKAVILSANNHSLTYVTTNLSVNYDGEASYTYVEGEELEISCKKALALDINSILRLEYHNAAGIPLLKTKTRDKSPHLLRIVLKSENNNHYLDCILATESPRKEYRYRTTFLKKKEDLQAESMQPAMMYVNGQELTPIINKDPSYDDYIFRYIENCSKLNVTCRKTDHIKLGSLRFYTNYIDQTYRTHRESGVVISTNISTSNLTNKTLNCGINNTDVIKSNARILFLLDEQCHDVCIRGLPKNNILYQYTNAEKQWTIEYQYSVSETLNLTFVSNTGFKTMPTRQLMDPGLFRWTFKGKFDNSSAQKSAKCPSFKWSEKTFTQNLDETHNDKKLRCIFFPNGSDDPYVNSSVELILRLKPELGAEVDEVGTSAEDTKLKTVYIALSVGAAVGIITMICLVLWWKRTKRTHLMESEYDNLSNRNDSPIPAFPIQWETDCDDSHYAKIDEEVIEENDTYTADTDTDKLYRMPYKRQSNTSENHYTEIDDLKPKPAGLAISCNKAHSSNSNKEKDTQYNNNFYDPKQGTYDKLRHNNLPINKNNENYSNVQKAGKSKTVTFKQMSNDLRPGHNYSEGISRQHRENKDRRLKQNSDGHYANVSHDIYMQPRDLQKKPNYENHFPQNERSENNDYAEPYGDLGVTCKNEFYG